MTDFSVLYYSRTPAKIGRGCALTDNAAGLKKIQSSKKGTKVMKKIFKSLSARIIILFALPFYAVLFALCGIAAALREFRKDFAVSFCRSMTDPEHFPPVGMKGFMAIRSYRQKAQKALDEEDDELAVFYWKKCAAYFDSDAMYELAKYYKRRIADDPDNRKYAGEWYAVAASFGHIQADKDYDLNYCCALSDEEKYCLRKNFMKIRRNLLKLQVPGSRSELEKRLCTER